MSPIPTMPQRHCIISRSPSPSLSDEEDAITPALDPLPLSPKANLQQLPLFEPQHAAPARRLSPDSRPASVSSDNSRSQQQPFDPAEGQDIDTAHLWRRMLALQRRFHCYNSARMSAALEDEGVEALVPPRICLDLLNDSVSKLPEQALRQVTEFLEHGDFKRWERKTVRRMS